MSVKDEFDLSLEKQFAEELSYVPLDVVDFTLSQDSIHVQFLRLVALVLELTGGFTSCTVAILGSRAISDFLTG